MIAERIRARRAGVLRWLGTALAVLAHWWPVVVAVSVAAAGPLIVLGYEGHVIPVWLAAVSWLAGFAGCVLAMVHQCFDCHRCLWRVHREFCSGPGA